MRVHRIGNDKDGYNDVPFTAEEEAAKDADIQAGKDGIPPEKKKKKKNNRKGFLRKTQWMGESDVHTARARRNDSKRIKNYTGS